MYYQIYVLTPNGKTIIIDILNYYVNAYALKILIEQKEGIQPMYQRLTCNGKSLYDYDKISYGSTIILTIFDNNK